MVIPKTMLEKYLDKNQGPQQATILNYNILDRMKGAFFFY